MAQSNDSNVRGVSPFWPNHTLEPPHAWTQWSDQFQLAIIAKENLDLESLHGPEILETQIPILNKQQAASRTRKKPTEREREQEQKHNETVQIRRRETDQRREEEI